MKFNLPYSLILKIYLCIAIFIFLPLDLFHKGGKNIVKRHKPKEVILEECEIWPERLSLNQNIYGEL